MTTTVAVMIAGGAAFDHLGARPLRQDAYSRAVSLGLPLRGRAIRRWAPRMAPMLNGAMAASLAETRVVLVPFWRSLPPTEFMRWFRSHANRVPILHVPVGGAALASSLLALSALDGSGGSPLLRWLETGTLVGFGLITTLVHLPANYRLTFGTRSDSEISSLLDRWVRWHDVRLGLLVVSTAAGIAALEPIDGEN